MKEMPIVTDQPSKFRQSALPRPQQVADLDRKWVSRRLPEPKTFHISCWVRLASVDKEGPGKNVDEVEMSNRPKRCGR